MTVRAKGFFHTVVTKAFALAQRCKTRKGKVNPSSKTATGNGPTSLPTNAKDDAPSQSFQPSNCDAETPNHNKSNSGKTGDNDTNRLEARRGTGSEHRLKPELTGASCGFVVATDGENDCLALLIDKQMLSTLREIASGRLALERKEHAYEDARINALFSTSSIDRSDEWTKVVDLQEEATKMREENEEGISQVDQAELKRDTPEDELNFLRYEVNQKRDDFQDIIERALRDANLLIPSRRIANDINSPAEEVVSVTENEETPSESRSPQLQLYQHHNARNRKSPVKSVARDTNSAASASCSISSSCVRYDEANEILNMSRLALQLAQEDFDNRHDEYWQQLDEWKTFIAEGQGIVSRTEFDLWAFKRGQILTRELMYAEDRYRYAKAHAKSFGIIADPRDQFSDFSDREDDGYRESEEAKCIEAVDRDFLKAWSRGVSMFPDIGEDDESVSVEVDEWTAQPVGISDSASMRDTNEYRGKIDRWRSSCENHREYWQLTPWKQLAWGVKFIVNSEGEITNILS